MTDYGAWEKKARALAEEANEEEQRERSRNTAGSNDSVVFPEPIADGASYIVRATAELMEEVTVERSATVGAFVEKVRGEFYFDIHQLLYHDPASKSDLDLVSSTHANRAIVELVPPGSTLKLVNPGVELVDKLQASQGYKSPHVQGAPADVARTMVGLSPGERVKIVELQGRPELNGKVGKVERWVTEKHRWEVRLDSMRTSDAPLGLKPANLERVIGAPAELEVVAPSKLQSGFLAGGLKDVRSKPRGALVFLCDSGASGDALRQQVSDLTCGGFEDKLQAAGITTVVYPCRKGASERGVHSIDWFDAYAIVNPKASEDISGVCESLEFIDEQVDKIVATGIRPERIGVVGHGMGGCVALHLAFGQGRYSGQLGAVACERAFLTEDSILPQAASIRFRKDAPASPPLFMGHGVDDAIVPMVWADDTRRRLGAAGVRVLPHIVSFSDTAHDLSATELQQMHEFFVSNLIQK